MKVLLTGSSGFLGRYVLKIISPDFEVTSITRQPKDEKGWLVSDILDLSVDDLKGYDAIIHMAGAKPGKGFSDEEYHRLNEYTTKHLLDTADKAGVSRFVYLSTTSVDSTSKSAYTLSKRNAEHAVRKSNLDWTILRPSYIYGLDSGFWENMFLTLGKKKWFLLLKGSSNIKFHPVYVSDVASAIINVLESEISKKKAYYIAGTHPITYSQFYREIRTEMKNHFFIFKLPKWLCAILGLISQRLKNDNVSNESYDISKAEADFGYKPHQYSKSFCEILRELNRG